MSVIVRGLFATSSPPISASMLRGVLLDGTERLADLGPVALGQIHSATDLRGVSVESFGLSNCFGGQGSLKRAATLAERRTFIRCVRWVLDGVETGQRTTICGDAITADAVLLAVVARAVGDLDEATTLLSGEVPTPTPIQLDAAAWALQLP